MTELREGQLLRANDWGPKVVWALAIALTLFGLLSFIAWLDTSDPNAAVAAGAYVLFALFCARTAVVGLVIEENEVKIRTLWHTYRVTWLEIKTFELRNTRYRPSLRVTLADGRTFGVVGLAGRTTDEKKRAQRIFDELNARLASELERQHEQLPHSH